MPATSHERRTSTVAVVRDMRRELEQRGSPEEGRLPQVQWALDIDLSIYGRSMYMLGHPCLRVALPVALLATKISVAG